MPTYEYACLSCKRHVEAVQSFSDEPLRTCQYCGGPLKRVYHPVGIVLKGSGFYSTDNRSGRSKAASESKKETGSESTSKESSKESSTEPSKPDAKKSESSTSTSGSKKSDSGTKS